MLPRTVLLVIKMYMLSVPPGFVAVCTCNCVLNALTLAIQIFTPICFCALSTLCISITVQTTIWPSVTFGEHLVLHTSGTTQWLWQVHTVLTHWIHYLILSTQLTHASYSGASCHPIGSQSHCLCMYRTWLLSKHHDIPGQGSSRTFVQSQKLCQAPSKNTLAVGYT